MLFSLQNHKLSKFLPSQICLLFGLTFGMFKAEARPKVLSIDTLMLEGIFLPLEELIWTPVYLNVKIAGNENMLPVVATTYQNGTCSLLTSAKLSIGYLVVGITRELNKEPSLHCSSIYINTM